MKSKYLNTEVREAMRKRNLAQYEVAAALGIAPGTFAQWLLFEFDQERKERVLNAIQNCEGKRSQDMNKDIRAAISKRGLALYEVANAMGVKPSTFAHWLLKELTPEQKERVFTAIESIEI